MALEDDELCYFCFEMSIDRLECVTALAQTTPAFVAQLLDFPPLVIAPPSADDLDAQRAARGGAGKRGRVGAVRYRVGKRAIFEARRSELARALAPNADSPLLLMAVEPPASETASTRLHASAALHLDGFGPPSADPAYGALLPAALRTIAPPVAQWGYADGGCFFPRLPGANLEAPARCTLDVIHRAAGDKCVSSARYLAPHAVPLFEDVRVASRAVPPAAAARRRR
jgi:hypothetical protein